MSQQDTEDPITQTEIEAVPVEAQSETEGAQVEETVVEQDPIAEMQAEVDKWKDLALRNAAEMDNYRKRVARDLQDARTYSNADLLRSLFPILDNFEMGLEAARAENEKSMIFMGLSMVRRQLADFLRDQSVEEINPESGATFDPNIHEAVSQEASEGIADGAILRVSRRGFKLKDRLLRPATVVVSSGPATADAGDESSAQ